MAKKSTALRNAIARRAPKALPPKAALKRKPLFAGQKPHKPKVPSYGNVNPCAVAPLPENESRCFRTRSEALSFRETIIADGFSPTLAQDPSQAKPWSVSWYPSMQQPKRLPPPPPVRNKPAPPPPKPAIATTTEQVEFLPLNTFPEGAKVNIPGCPDMQGLTIERVSHGGVTVSGGKLSPSTVLSGASPAVLCYSRPPTAKEPGLTVVVPTPGSGDFSSMAPGGSVAKGNIPGKRTPPPPPGHRAPPPVARAPKANGPKREGVCAFIDNLIMEGGRTKQQVLELVIAQFPDRDPKATLTTIGIRPTHIRAKGLTPPPFAK